ncbi:hypothetical protein BKA82DRAFT_334187 [Pisolithus tinctorius]|uniref:Uncharacterized protein n=1 Tax=Pisolithus tinctorius Marx 270 TaxID=870435 RepID=A0A0C3NMB8_PISTI|nr:hypothetical protein BKA82DRAFT_334187 [Pisolithus tinctorius]KIN95048.1 hypothetical protein M404DRAFT_334187 [Pisolithus tinctorius Marx 270]KIN96765.1 hypothetical protein M404DRAFT_927682 [Pisolithus tinctorius Marx 270]
MARLVREDRSDCYSRTRLPVPSTLTRLLRSGHYKYVSRARAICTPSSCIGVNPVYTRYRRWGPISSWAETLTLHCEVLPPRINTEEDPLEHLRN